MSAYDQTFDRSGTQALMPEDVQREIVQGMVTSSIIMQLARRLPDMPRAQRRMPVLSAMPTAYFVTGSGPAKDRGLKKTTEMSWENKFLNANEIAVIAPIPTNVLDDADYNIWGEVKPRIAEQFAKIFDLAVLRGTNAPSDWPLGLYDQCSNIAGSTFDPSLASFSDLFEATLGEGGNVAAIEECGFLPTAHVGALRLRSKFRGIRDADGNLIFKLHEGPQGNTTYTLDGAPLYFPRNSVIDPSEVLMYSGDWNELVWSVRMDLNYKLLDQAVIQDDSGNITHNLAQMDMVAVRATMRLAWQLPNPINLVQSDEALRLPFSILKP